MLFLSLFSFYTKIYHWSVLHSPITGAYKSERRVNVYCNNPSYYLFFSKRITLKNFNMQCKVKRCQISLYNYCRMSIKEL